MLRRLDHPRFDLGNKRGCPFRVVECNEITDFSEVGPRGGQDNQAWHGQDLTV